MIRRYLPDSVFAILTLLVLGFVFLVTKVPVVSSAVAEHVVISEVMIKGGVANDEFVELYNPTATAVDMEGWRLRRTSASGSTGSNLVADISGTISANGYFLVAHPDFDGGVAVDLPYSATTSAMAANNVIILYSDAGVTEVDKLGLGTAENFEGTGTVENPVNEGSVERKAFSSSTSVTMGVGGDDENMGNGEDTDDNSADFVQRSVAQPQNSTVTESPSTPSPTATATVEPTVTPTVTPSPTTEPTTTPTVTPTATPEPTATSTPTASATPEPTVTPTATPEPTDTPTPTATPTEEPTASPTPTEEPTMTPTASATPTKEPTMSPTPMPTETLFPSPRGRVLGVFPFLRRTVVCRMYYREINFGWWGMKHYFPYVVCR